MTAFIQTPTAVYRNSSSSSTRRTCTRRTLLAFALTLPTSTAAVLATELLEYEKQPSGLIIQDLRFGSGITPSKTSTVRVRWTGRLTARYGWPFQSEPAENIFNLTRDTLIPGFIEGVTTMRAGGKRRLIIPSHLGYQRNSNYGPLPADFGNRRRLLSTVSNPRRSDDNAGAVVIDLELLTVINK